jgi:hypothetical protein
MDGVFVSDGDGVRFSSVRPIGGGEVATLLGVTSQGTALAQDDVRPETSEKRLESPARSRRPVAGRRRFVVCVRNDGYEASLERNIYPFLRDDDAERGGDLRIVDESGEDYLFSADRFVPIQVPAAVRASLLKAARARKPLQEFASRAMRASQGGTPFTAGEARSQEEQRSNPVR